MSGAGGTAVAAVPKAPPERVVAVVGPPNSGKSTLFNRLTGLRQKVANYPGVTVEKRVGRPRQASHRHIQLVDLPGVYSLTPRSEDERVTHDVLLGAMADMRRPDAVILILDATNLGRHLMLAAPILSLGVPTLVVLNMADELQSRRGDLNLAELAEQLGAPVALVSAKHGQGMEAVEEFLDGNLGVPRPVDLPAPGDVPNCRQWSARVNFKSRYQPPQPSPWTQRLDAVLLHPFWGLLIFAAVLVLVFQTIFTAAVPLMDAVEVAIGWSGEWVASVMPDSWLRNLLVEGVWGGVGSVLVFLPQILILSFFIALLEDSGYMARAALIADRSMAKVGLQGKSFIPLLSAYACAVPAIMATRTIENQRDRFATILIAPFMTCAARLPVYTMVIAAFIPERPVLGPFLGTRAATLLGLYLLGFLVAVATAWILKSSVLRSKGVPFTMEMPPYRLPNWRSLGLRLVDRAGIFLRRAGTVILGAAVVLWLLASVPPVDGGAPPIEESVAGTIGRAIEPVFEPLGFNWRIAIGIVSSLAAREVLVGTLGTIYGMEAESMGYLEALRSDLTFGGAVALLVFFAFAMQCMSTVAIVRRETGGWKWPILQFLYMGVLAYAGGLLANQLLTGVHP